MIIRKNTIPPSIIHPYVDAFRRLIFEESSNLRDSTVEDNVCKRPLPVNNSRLTLYGYMSYCKITLFLLFAK